MSIFSSSSPQQILNNQLNNSSAKFQYSFPQADRFKVQQSACQKSFYSTQIPEEEQQWLKRGTSFGSGQRSDFTRTQYSNYAPNSDYLIESDFDKKIQKKYGKSFGLSRDKTKSKGYINQNIAYNPGPGSHQNYNKSNSKSISYTMRPKTANANGPSFLGGSSTSQNNPGPGQYNQEPAITLEGKYSHSKYKGSGSTKFNPGCSERFMKSGISSPGVGSYNITSPTRGGKSFGSSSRKTFIDEASKKSNITPGAGQYKKPSDFGHYDNQSSYSQKRKKNAQSSSNLSHIKQMSSFYSNNNNNVPVVQLSLKH